MDDALPNALYPVVGRSGLPGVVTLTPANSSTTTRRTVTSNWRARRSVSRIRYGKQPGRVMRLDDGRAGFGRRRSPEPGPCQTIGLSRKSAHQELHTTRAPGTSVSASDLVSRKTNERIELGQKYVNLFRPADLSRFPPVFAPLRRELHPVNEFPWTKNRQFRSPQPFSPCPVSKKGIQIVSRVRRANL